MKRLLLCFCVLLAPPAFAAAPDVPGALEAVVSTPLDLAGDLAGAAGLISAAALATAGDVLALVDDNPRSTHVFGGAISQGVKRVASGLSQLGTGLLEGLRGEDIERLPEPPEAYLSAAPFYGRLDTALGGISALRLAVVDTASAPFLVLLRASGAAETAARLSTWRDEARIRALGPEPLPSPHAP